MANTRPKLYDVHGERVGFSGEPLSPAEIKAWDSVAVDPPRFMRHELAERKIVEAGGPEDRQSRVIGEVVAERHSQDRQWGVQDHAIGDWFMILGEEYGEACEAGCRYRFGKFPAAAEDDLRAELIQVAAVAVAMVEAIDRKRAGGS